MKTVLICSFYIYTLISSSLASTSRSLELRTCDELSQFLDFKLNYEKKELLNLWDEFDAIKYIKKGTMERHLYEINTINSFALVPSAPLIENHEGIPKDYLGHRLFLISRAENINKSGDKGRYAILIKPEELDSKPAYPKSCFIPEETAQLILSQIKGFDPEKQPLAFDKEFVKEVERTQKNRSLPTVEQQSRDPKRPPVPEQDQERQSKNTHTKDTTFYGIVAALILIALGLIAVWIRRGRPS